MSRSQSSKTVHEKENWKTNRMLLRLRGPCKKVICFLATTVSISNKEPAKTRSDIGLMFMPYSSVLNPANRCNSSIGSVSLSRAVTKSSNSTCLEVGKKPVSISFAWNTVTDHFGPHIISGIKVPVCKTVAEVPDWSDSLDQNRESPLLVDWIPLLFQLLLDSIQSVLEVVLFYPVELLWLQMSL
jgi:hypothetical protein